MDPVSGISLAASVVQLVSFGAHTIEMCKELYEQGHTRENDATYDAASRLARLTKDVKLSLGPHMPTRTLSREEQDLVGIAQRCTECATKLQDELRKLQTRPQASALQVAHKATHSIWKKKSLAKVKEELELYRSTLETSLLQRLSKRFDAHSLQTSERLVTMDKNVQQIITCLANSETSLVALTTQHSEQLRQLTTSHVERLEKRFDSDRLYREVTRSLFFPEIFSRQEQVEAGFDGLENSYDWIFDKSQTKRSSTVQQPDDSKNDEAHWGLADWLQSCHGVYWINGKAGSGKSTLMNYICRSERRIELLKDWRPNRQLLTPSFFFWNAGSNQQKCINGLLRSIIYQILTSCQDLIRVFKDEPLHAWNEGRLLAALEKLLRQDDVPIATCIFIDGLDEFESEYGRYDGLVKAIRDMSKIPHVKICLSSRPLLVFEDCFASEPSLRLERLTFQTIKSYVQSQLAESINEYHSRSRPGETKSIQRLLGKIVYRADGVFLWAVIAAKELREGLSNMVDIDQLSQAVDSLPAALEDLFMLMLNRIRVMYQHKAALFLQIALYHPTGLSLRYIKYLSLYLFYFIQSQSVLEDSQFTFEQLSVTDMNKVSHKLRIQILSHTAGLLDLTPHYRDYGGEHSCQEYSAVLFHEVGFAHRTVRDFLMNNEEAKGFLTRNGAPEPRVRLAIARGYFCKLQQFPFEREVVGCLDRLRIVHEIFLEALLQVTLAEQILGTAQIKLLRSLNYEDFAHGQTVTPSERESQDRHAFNIQALGRLVDLVGMAAAVGMKFFVLEQLGDKAPPITDLRSLSTLGKKTSHYRSYEELLRWSPDLQWGGANISATPAKRGNSWNSTQRLISHSSSLSSYRSILSRCLQIKTNTGASTDPQMWQPSSNCVETYLLNCCGSQSSLLHRGWGSHRLELIQTLLNRGANPMAQFHLDTHDGHKVITSFWYEWLLSLTRCRVDYMRVNSLSGGMLLDKRRQISQLNIFNVTKLLISCGADIQSFAPFNFSTDLCSGEFCPFLKRAGLEFEQFEVEATASFDFLVLECFREQPGFTEFAEALESKKGTVRRRLLGIKAKCMGPQGEFRTFGGDTLSLGGPYGDQEEHEDLRELWPLIKRWEDTGYRRDMNELQAALRRIFIAHCGHPEWLDETTQA